MSSELETLIKKRGIIKAKLTRFITYLNKFGIESNTITKDDRALLQSKVAKIDGIFSDFSSIQYEIGVLVDDVNAHEAESEEFEEKFFAAHSLANTILQDSENVGNQSNTLHNRISQTRNSNKVSKPLINLPTFDGSFDKWCHFRDLFISMVHSDPSLSDVERLHFLNTSLKGDASVILNSVPICDDSYSTAWNMLNERYENKQLIVDSHIHALFNLNSTKRDSYKSVQGLLDNLLWHIRSLEKLGLPVKSWDSLIIYLVSIKLDTSSKREWDAITSENINDLPTFDELLSFLNKRCRYLGKNVTNDNQHVNKVKTTSLLSTHKSNCLFCNDSHYISQCDTFSKLSPNRRIEETKKMHLCINCLGKGHSLSSCKSKFSCKQCHKKHHSLLHIEARPSANANSDDVLPSTSKGLIVTHASSKDFVSQILLSTVCIRVADSSGNWHTCRALLDNGSQSNFITAHFFAKLKLRSIPVHSKISLVSQASFNLNQRADIRIRSKYGSFETSLNCLIINNITDNIPATSFDASSLNIPNNINLADPTFNQEGKIDMLLGASIFWDLLCVGQIKLGEGNPCLHKTRLGWILSGPLSCQENQQAKSLCHLSVNLETQLEHFWQIEECSSNREWSLQEQECETHFLNTTTRDQTGRFIVSIPFNSQQYSLGESRHLALKRFYSTERRLNKDIGLKRDYVNFMREYEQLGHMKLINESDDEPSCKTYYLPHHAVIKSSSSTTKTRVVFDGSAKTATGISLNDVQNVGPVIQDDIFALLLRFRQHAFVITADIEKMYRQILISERDRKYHRILWRSDISENVQCYELQTVTYGTASASFLTTRCLLELASENESKYPNASTVIKRDFYVDDLLTGGNSIQELEKLRGQITDILSSAGFNLRKWLGNYPLGVENPDSVERFQFGDQGESRTLGVSWDSQLDSLKYEIVQTSANFTKHVTKRSILAITAKIFDPLGLLGPVIIIAKLIMQNLWQHKLSWDESVPHDLHRKWLKFLEDISSIAIVIPRFIFQPNFRIVECHGFSDASERAYGACVYARCVNPSGECTVNLMCAKSRVAPLRKVTLPRLELCAAALLTDIVVKIRGSLSVPFDSYHFWSDSTITLSWIKSSPSRWQTFVANRVSKIQSRTNQEEWHHVRSHDNPADLLSRGISPSLLSSSSLWWHGPAWLLKKNNEWPGTNPNFVPEETLPEMRKIVGLTQHVPQCDLFQKFSSFPKLQRITAWILRFVGNCRIKCGDRQSGSLSAAELQHSVIILVKVAQTEAFSTDIKKLQSSESHKFKDNLLSLNPFLDSDCILRVGGRTRESNFTYSKKHPIILPKHHLLTDLIIRYEHVRLLHSGPQAVLASLRERFWPISGRSRVKKIVRDCVICLKSNPPKTEYLMGNLPRCRLTPSNAFQTCGVDYAGPFFTKTTNTRGSKISKAYICLFVCMATKAIHLELVSALTTEAFLATFRRFISRRGKPKDMYSDNGSNFVGAERELRKLLILAKHDIIQKFTANEGINWHFIPARSPHFGGLWEAGIKSTKKHLTRVLQNASLTFEDFYTVLAQIEAILNSRPISPLSEDPNDLNPLTPGHFLIGKPPTSLPEPSLENVRENRLSRYQRLQNLMQHYWRRWSKEYVTELQTRNRWKCNNAVKIKIGDMVILREDNLPPCHWKLGRIVELHPGKDGVTRVATVKTVHAIVKRSMTQLCILPIS